MLRYDPRQDFAFDVQRRDGTPCPSALSENDNPRLSSRDAPYAAESTRALRVLQVMPPGKHFGPARATSIDLDTYDLVRFSRYRDATMVTAAPVDVPYSDVSVHCYKSEAAVVEDVLRTARQCEVDVIVVQQRLPLAARIAQALPDIPVVLRLHNMQKSFEDRFLIQRHIRRAYRQRLYNRIAGIVHVSNTCQADFERKWPEVRVPAVAIGNGLDFSEWRPRHERAQEVLLVARCIPEKGVLEAVQAMANVFPQFSGWKGRVILSSVDEKPAYAARVFEVLNQSSNVISVETDRPFAEVRAANERAAIALVPSRWVEPFGRTALEAHAGGAALISSGTGGLSEISGETALMLPEVTSEAIEEALKSLITDDARRTQLARAGAARARKLFDIRAQAAVMDQFLEQIASEKAGERHV